MSEHPAPSTEDRDPLEPRKRPPPEGTEEGGEGEAKRGEEPGEAKREEGEAKRGSEEPGPRAVRFANVTIGVALLRRTIFRTSVSGRPCARA